MNLKQEMKFMKHSAIYWLFRVACMSMAATLCMTAFVTAQAQGNVQNLQQEKQWQSCEGGYYTGPREGRRNYSFDKYLWVVTPEFAKRFCMPSSMVSAELKGAEAIAFRMVDGADSDNCGVDEDGKAHCTENSTARFEIYLPTSLKLPAANPQVRFFEGGRTTSSWNIADNTPLSQAKHVLYPKGQYQIPPGQLPRFGNAYAHPDPGHRFGLIYAHEGQGRWPVSPLWEVGFRGDLFKGMDLLVLENQLGVFFGFEMDQYKASKVQQDTKQGQYLIVMDRRDSQQPGSKQSSEKEIPSGHAHVIYLPHEFGQQVRQVAMKQGGSSWLEFIKTIQQR